MKARNVEVRFQALSYHFAASTLHSIKGLPLCAAFAMQTRAILEPAIATKEAESGMNGSEAELAVSFRMTRRSAVTVATKASCLSCSMEKRSVRGSETSMCVAGPMFFRPLDHQAVIPQAAKSLAA